MAISGIIPGSVGAEALTEEWTSEIMLKPNEEAVIASDVMRPKGVRRGVGNKLHITILPIIAAQELAAGDQGQGSGITAHTGTILEVEASPVFSYGVVELPDHFVSKLKGGGRDSAVEAGYRKQLLASMATKQDVEIGELVASLLNQLGGPGNFDQAGLLALIGTVVTNAKEFINMNEGGTPNLHVKYHPSQFQYINSIAGISHAYARGDGKGTRGVVQDAWKSTFAETGNIYTAAGVAYNVAMTKECFVIAFNEEPMIKPTQDFELTRRIIAKQEFAVAEQFDEAGACWRSPV